MTLFMRELKRNYKFTLLWAISISLMNAVMMYLFPSIAQKNQDWDNLISQMPQEMLAGFGMDKLKISDIIGYYGTQVYTLVLLFGGIFAIMLFAGMLSKEENDKTIEFLLAKPLTRNQIIAGKVFSGMLLLLVFNLVVTGVTYLAFEGVKTDDYSLKVFILLAAGLLLLCVTFAAVGLVLSVFLTRTKTLLSLTIGIVLITYIIGIASGMSKKLDSLRYFSPFKYVDATDIVLNSRITGNYLVTLLAVSVVLILLTILVYNKKDISV